VRIVIESSAQAAEERIARIVADAIRWNPSCVLGLAAGRTVEPVYARLAAIHREEGLSLRTVTTFNLDEYVGATHDDSWSFHRFVAEHLVEPTDLPASSVHAPEGNAADLFAEAQRYEEAIQRAGGIDLQLLGLGQNGHIGFNEPGSSLASPTRAKALTEETLRANQADLAASGSTAPQAAITMGLGTILAARACLLLAVGSAKANAVAAMVEGPVTARVPASVLQQHPRATVVLDAAAAAQLEARDYYERAERLQRQLEESSRA
jgi:glucosamine-6-phosphate deaminase